MQESITEEQLLADALRLDFKYWWSKLSALEGATFLTKEKMYQESLSNIPGSYKIWFYYLRDFLEYVEDLCILNPEYIRLCATFERCLIYMHKMPRIWIMYIETLMSQKKYKLMRASFDRCLRALPLTQHHKIWDIMFPWFKELKSPKLGIHYFERYLKLNEEGIEDYIEYLLGLKQYELAFSKLVSIINDESFISVKGKSKYEYSMELCNLISQHPDKCATIDPEAIIRHCLGKFTDEIGNLWVCLAEFYIKQGLFDMGRDTFEEALESVATARDFGVVYSAYLKFEEDFVTVLMEEGGDVEIGERDVDFEMLALSNEIDALLGLQSPQEGISIDSKLVETQEDIAIRRIESLLERRDLLLNSCSLRQNPSGVKEWVERLDILESDQEAYCATFEEALSKINPLEAEGEISQLWIKYATFYELQGDLPRANQIYWTATQYPYNNIQKEGIPIWIGWCEMLLRAGSYSDAQRVIRYPLNLSPDSDYGNIFVHSYKLWSLCLDLTINFGSQHQIRSVYDRMIDLRVITPKCLLNYAHYLYSLNYYEESFRVFEKGLSIFRWDALRSIWINYLLKFEERYAEKKLERLRDLYERVLTECPKEKKLIFYIMYSQMEEKHGLLNHAIEVIDRMTDEVVEENKLRAFNIYVFKVAEYLGVIRTKPIYEKGLESLKGRDFINFGMRYASLEKRLGEIDRARQIYSYLAPFVDPDVDQSNFWGSWVDFETIHGNSDTYKELKRIQRTVQSRYSILPPTLERIEKQVDEEELEDTQMRQEHAQLNKQGQIIKKSRELSAVEKVIMDEMEKGAEKRKKEAASESDEDGEEIEL